MENKNPLDSEQINTSEDDVTAWVTRRRDCAIGTRSFAGAGIFRRRTLPRHRNKGRTLVV